MNEPKLLQRAAELRREFDLAFARAPRERLSSTVDLLAIGLGGDSYALRLSVVGGLFTDKKLTRLPCAAPEFLGIAGFRGSVVPVYDLRALLGYPGGGAPRWLAVAATAAVALAFDSLDGYLRLPREAIAPQERDGSPPQHVQEVARTAGLIRPIVNVGSILEAIGKPARQGAS